MYHHHRMKSTIIIFEPCWLSTSLFSEREKGWVEGTNLILKFSNREVSVTYNGYTVLVRHASEQAWKISEPWPWITEKVRQLLWIIFIIIKGNSTIFTHLQESLLYLWKKSFVNLHLWRLHLKTTSLKIKEKI